MRLKNLVSTAAIVGTLAAGALAVFSSPAGAYVTCNRDGDCWHSDRRENAPGVRFEHHPDDWYFHQRWQDNNERHYRDYHDGRGYYKGGVWIQL